MSAHGQAVRDRPTRKVEQAQLFLILMLALTDREEGGEVADILHNKMPVKYASTKLSAVLHCYVCPFGLASTTRLACVNRQNECHPARRTGCDTTFASKGTF
eukprot:57089-Rhodomonas_salina.1